MDTKDIPPPPVKAPGTNARRIQHNFANTPERESAAAAWVAVSKSFSTKPLGLATTTTATTATVIVTSASEEATPTNTWASKAVSRGGLLTTSNDFQSFLAAANTFVPSAPTTKPSADSEDDASEAKDDALTEPELEPREEVDVGSDCGSQSITTDRSANKDSGRSARGPELGSTRGSELGSAKGSEPSDTRPSRPGDSAWGEPVEKGGQVAQDDGATNLLVLEENDKDKEAKKEVDKMVNKPVDRTYNGGLLATSNDFQSFLNASCKFVPPTPAQKEAPAPKEVSEDGEAKKGQTVTDPDPEVPKKEEEKHEEKKHEEEEEHALVVTMQQEKEDKHVEKEDVGSDGKHQSHDDRSAKGSGTSDSGQPSESGDNAWGETAEKGGQEAKDDGAHPNLIVLEESDKEANKDVNKDVANKLLQEASDKLEVLQKAGQVEPKVAVEAALPVSPEVRQDGPEVKIAAETALPVSPAAHQDSPMELKVDVETALPVSPPAPQDDQAELKVTAGTTLPVSPPALEEAGQVDLQIPVNAVPVSPVS